MQQQESVGDLQVELIERGDRTLAMAGGGAEACPARPGED